MSEYLAFRVGKEEYGINILSVQELRQFEVPTRIANAPAHHLGVVDLRGTVVPIIDLRVLLLQDAGAFTSETVVVFVVQGRDLIGLVVDAVNDVVAPTEQQVHAVPALGATARDGALVDQIATLASRNVLLTSVAALLGDVGSMPATPAALV